MSPSRSGVTLAITVATFYSLCTVIWVISPDQSIVFLNNLFHGLDFRGMYTPGPFQWVDFGSTLCIWTFCAFMVGFFYAWLAARVARW